MVESKIASIKFKTILISCLYARSKIDNVYNCFVFENWYVQVSVPCSSMLTIVTVRCGHCANLLSVNMGASLQTLPPQDPQVFQFLVMDYCMIYCYVYIWSICTPFVGFNWSVIVCFS